MSEQGLSPENNPVVAGPEEVPGTAEQQSPTPPQEGTDGWWQHQHQQLQQGFTQHQQEYREYQRLVNLALTADDPDTQRQALEAIGFQLPDEEPEEPEFEPGNPWEQLAPRVERLEQSWTQAEQQRQQEEKAVFARQLIDQRLEALGLNDRDGNRVLADAMHALPSVYDEEFGDEFPDIKSAYEKFVADETERQREWAKTKRAPHISPVGQAATEVPNLDNDQQRRDWMVAQLQANEQ